MCWSPGSPPGTTLDCRRRIIRYTTGTLSDLTAALNEAITELSAPLTPADGTLSSATSQLNALLAWAGSPLPPADGTLSSASMTYNSFAAAYIFNIRFYILPIERNITNNSRGPEYFSWRYDPDPPGFTCQWSMKDYGSVDMAILAANISDADHNTLALDANIYSYPVSLTPTMTLAQRSAMNTYLEAHGIPGDWLAPGDTFASAARVVTSMMLYQAQVCGILGYPADPYAGLTLNTQYRNIPNPLHDAMQQAALDLGYTWNVSNNDQIRKIFKLMADQWGSASIYFGFTTL